MKSADGNNPAALSNRGVLFLETGRFSEGIQALRNAASAMVLQCADTSQQKNDRHINKQQVSPAVLRQQHGTTTGERASLLDCKHSVELRNRHTKSSVLCLTDLAIPSTITSEATNTSCSGSYPSSSAVSSRETTRRRPAAVFSARPACPAAKRQRRAENDVNQSSSPIPACLGSVNAQRDDKRHSMARPIWLSSQHERKPGVESLVLSATIVYNLGLSFHTCASASIDRCSFRQRCGNRVTSEEEDDKSCMALYKRALEFYKMAAGLMLRKSMMLTRCQSPALVATLHNMGLVYRVLGACSAARWCQNQLAQLLRVMERRQKAPPPRQNNSNKGYEEFLLGMLTLPKSTAMAGAA